MDQCNFSKECNTLQPQEPPEFSFVWTDLNSKFKKQQFYKKLILQQRDPRIFRKRFEDGKLINYKMRNRLANWLKTIALTTFQFSCYAFIQAMQILDQYLSLTNENFAQLQLIGCAVLYLSSKLTQEKIIAAQSYVFSAGQIFTKEQLQKKEKQIYETLNYDLTFMNPLKIFHYFNSTINVAKNDNLKIAEKLILESFFERQYEGISEISLGFMMAILAANNKLNKQQLAKLRTNQLLFK